MLGFSYLSAELSFANTGSTALFPYKMRLGYLSLFACCRILFFAALFALDNFRHRILWQGVGDGGKRKGGCSASLGRAQAHSPRAFLPAPQFPGCLYIALEVLWSQFLLLQVDILSRALDNEVEGHLMCAFPTGYGKSLPMLLLGLLMPKGTHRHI